MSAYHGAARLALEAAQQHGGMYKAPDVIVQADAVHQAFMREYERFKRNRRIHPALMVTPDSYPKMCELFEAVKAHLDTLTSDYVEDQGLKIRFSHFGRTFSIELLHTGQLRRNEVYLSIGHPEPIHTPMAIIGFQMPNHWEF
ncbi:MAG: hypothetical protein HYZ65_01005 [Burkholderiales bacterium]|nr:hypothetical protein [Burkholderiales bacterium]